MRRKLALIMLAICCQLSAQEINKAEIMEVVNNVFVAMRTSDSTLLKACFTSDVRMSTVYRDQNGITQFKEGSLIQFVKVVGAEKSDVYNEPIWNEQIQTDGPLAAVWVDYAFYLNTKFLHCGVDAFHLVKTEEGWKIFNLIDTRRKTDCVIPETVKAQFGG